VRHDQRLADKYCTPASLILLGSQTIWGHCEVVGGAADPPPPAIEHMGVNHPSAHIPMPEQLLNRPDVIAVFLAPGVTTKLDIVGPGPV
jgi:hypothetical protein